MGEERPHSPPVVASGGVFWPWALHAGQGAEAAAAETPKCSRQEGRTVPPRRRRSAADGRGAALWPQAPLAVLPRAGPRLVCDVPVWTSHVASRTGPRGSEAATCAREKAGARGKSSAGCCEDTGQSGAPAGGQEADAGLSPGASRLEQELVSFGKGRPAAKDRWRKVRYTQDGMTSRVR